MNKMKVIWFDLENSPHCWVLKEFIQKYTKMDYKILVTAREFNGTIALADYLNIKIDFKTYHKQSNSKISKLLQSLKRANKLRKFISSLHYPIDIALSHGSRSQVIACKILRIPCLSLDDYEHSFQGFALFASNILAPFPISPKSFGLFAKKVINYPGLKEHLYLWNRDNYNSNNNSVYYDYQKVNVLFRPEAPYAHYSCEKSRYLEKKIINRLCLEKNLNIILIARDIKQKEYIVDCFKRNNVSYHIPSSMLNGPNLIYGCDIVIGGGGTMTREASTLGIPSFTYFSGKLGQVDEYLIKNKKLFKIENEKDIDNIILKKTSKNKIDDIPETAFNFIDDLVIRRIGLTN